MCVLLKAKQDGFEAEAEKVCFFYDYIIHWHNHKKGGCAAGFVIEFSYEEVWGGWIKQPSLLLEHNYKK